MLVLYLRNSHILEHFFLAQILQTDVLTFSHFKFKLVNNFLLVS